MGAVVINITRTTVRHYNLGKEEVDSSNLFNSSTLNRYFVKK